MSDIDIGQISEALNNKVDLYAPCDIQAPYTFEKSPEMVSGINLKNNSIRKGTAPTNTLYWGIRANDNTSPGSSWENTRLGVLEWYLNSSNVTGLTLSAYKNALDTTSAASISLQYHGNESKPKILINGKEMVAFVTETYKSGTSWYRKYSDGWIEQGGRFSWSDNGQKGPINLLKTMADTNYSVQVRVVGTSADGSDTANIRDISTTSFYISAYSSSRTIMWEVKGFAA